LSWAAARARIKTVLEGVKITNLVENPSFEAGDFGYEVDAGLTGLVVVDVFYLETASLRVTGGGGASKTLYILKFDGTRMPVLANEFYAFSTHIKPDPANSPTTISGRPVIEWRDSGGAVISTTLGATANYAPADDWRRIDVGAVAPTNAVTARPGWRETGFWGGGKILYFDGVMFNQGSLLDYIDGSQAGCVWDGTAHESTSHRGIKVVYDNPPSKIADWPCFVMGLPSIDEITRVAHTRLKKYSVPLRLITRDEELSSSAGFLDAIREEVIDAFDDNVLLNGIVQLAGVQSAPSPVELDYGADKFVALDCILHVAIKEAYNFQT
jgi:hypothetical protein